MFYLDDSLTEAELGEAVEEMRETDKSEAGRIVARALSQLRERAETEWADDWSDYGAYRRYVAFLASATGYVGANGSPVVRMTGPDADVWGYVASDALDHAAQDLGNDFIIDEMKPGVYRLVRPTIVNHGAIWRIEWANGTRCVGKPSGGYNMLGEPTYPDAGEPVDFPSLYAALQFMGWK